MQLGAERSGKLFRLSEREQREYSLARAIITSAENQEATNRGNEENCLCCRIKANPIIVHVRVGDFFKYCCKSG